MFYLTDKGETFKETLLNKMSEGRVTNSESVDWVILNMVGLGAHSESEDQIVLGADMPDDDVKGHLRRLFEAGYLERES